MDSNVSARYHLKSRDAVLLLVCTVVALFGALSVPDAAAQSTSLVFTVPVPERDAGRAVGESLPVIEERGLALWAGTASDFGVGATLSAPKWTLRSAVSMTTLPIDGHRRSTFQQVEFDRSLLSTSVVSIAGAGGIRQEWDGTRVLIARVLAGAAAGHGTLQGSVVFERNMFRASEQTTASGGG
jgi:hypothetical protein